MAVPYFYVDDTHKVYFTCGFVVPVPKEYHRKQSIGRTENGKLKVYDQVWAGTYKRIWKIKVYFTIEEAATYYRLSDLLILIHNSAVFARNQFTFYDSAGNSHVVRYVSNSLPTVTIVKDLYEVNMELEEDYA